MSFYLHQWVYKDSRIKSMILKPQDRAEIVRVATEVFGGTLHQFFFSIGDYDGMAISEFEDNATALACLMTILGQGNVQRIKTTVLLTSEEMQRAMAMANSAVADAAP